MKEICKVPVSRTWISFYEETSFSDLTIACEDNKIQCHKAIVSSSSPMLENVLKKSSIETSFIILKGVKHANLKNLITFIYKGEVNICEEDLGGFLTLAQDLELKGLGETREGLDLLKINLPSKIANRKIENEFKDFSDESDNFNNTNFSDASNNFLNPTNIEDESDTFIKSSFVREFSKFDAIKHFIDDSVKEIDKQTEVIPNMGFERNVAVKSENVNYSEKIYSCDSCPKQYKSSGSFHRHRSSVHRGICFPCDQCESTFTRIQELNKHIACKHEGILYPCTQCDFIGEYPRKLRVHKKLIHQGVIYDCDKCDFKGKTPALLKRHLYVVHLGVGYPCKECDYVTKDKNCFKRHTENSH